MENASNHSTDRINNYELKTRNSKDSIYFNFSYAALKLLGKNLYSNAANAISELVANSIDARAPEVYVYIDMSDKSNSVIEIIDNGSGMSYSDLANKYVWIGRNKRTDAELSDRDRSTVMGRKGIGKLAALYLSNKYYILTKKTHDAVDRWEINLSAYSDSDFPKLDRVNEPIHIVNERIWNSFSRGTVIKLENVDLRRNGEKKIEGLRRVFADFYLVNAINTKIYVAVKTSNKDDIIFEQVKKKIAYKNFYALFDNSGLDIKSRMLNAIPFTWASKYPHIANKPRMTQCVDAEIYTERTSGEDWFYKENGELVKKRYNLKGWIAIHSSIDQKNAEKNDKNFLRNTVYQPNRLRLYVRNKLAVEDYFTISPSTQAMANYVEGEISFDILDDDELPDIATSSRQDFLDDKRIELLMSIVDPILTALFGLRNRIGKIITDENDQYAEELRRNEQKRREEEEAARKKAEEAKAKAEKAQSLAENERKKAEAVAHRERRRSQYVLNVSDIEDKNILNSVHSIYNMSNRVKENLDEINNLAKLDRQAKKKLEKASTSNLRILTVSKLISKAGRIIDDNDAAKKINLAEFINEYVNNVLRCIYDNNDININLTGDTESSFVIKIKPMSFIMMVDNLVGNAIKASAKNLLIIIDNSKTDSFFIIFKDDGKGIDPSVTNIEHLFEFGVTTTNGSGLGLFYAKKYMKQLEGSIAISSNDSKGVSVTLSFQK